MLFTLLFLVMLPASLPAQDDAFKNVQQRFELFNKQPVAEKLYVHTDKNFYLAGEIIWFKLYSVDPTTNQPVNFSKVAYLEVVDRTGKPVLQTKVELTKKGGAGSLYLPATLNSDNYVLRAYTTWMRNEGARSFFEKIISIVNTVKPSDKKFHEDSIRITAGFFPEGGNLVQGIESKVAFKITDQNGKGVDAHGILVNGSGDTLANFSPYKFGMGSFLFKPQQDQQYKAIFLLPEGKTFSTALPVAYNHGYTMSVTDNKDGRVKIIIRAKGSDATSRGEKLFLMAHNRQQIKKAETGFINYESDLVLYINKSDLGDGISYLTLFNASQQPVCERLVFKRPANDNRVSLKSDKAIYHPRQQVQVDMLLAAGIKNLQNDNYSIAVYRIDSLQEADPQDIASYIWLGSDLKGTIESSGFYFSNDEGVEEATDNLLLTQGWRRFEWEKILSPGKEKKVLFIPEYRGHLIAARVTNTSDGNLAKGVNCFLSYATAPFGFAVAKTDSKGIAWFDVKNYYGPGEIIVQAGTEAQSNYRVDVLTPFADEKINSPVPFLTIGKNRETELTDKNISMQVQNIYNADSVRRFIAPVFSDTLPFFGKAEYSYRLDDYKRFTTMEEVLREYVTPINVVLRGGKLYMSIYDETSQTVYHDLLLVLLDGVPVMDFQKIFSYDPLKVKRLDVVPRKYMVGGMNFKSIVSFETYNGKFDGFEMTPGLVAIDYDGLQLQRKFYSPVYENESESQKRIPDFRSTLYWNPNLPVDESGNTSMKFYTSDRKGDFLIVLQGINAKGEVVSGSAAFKVE